MVKWWYAFWMCWGMFCAIPCPVKVWEEKARPRMISCLPLIGLVVGALWWGLAWGLDALGVPAAVKAAALTAAPWLLSGCIHLDGFLDCCDAIFSRRDLETRQRILKDSHVGSFAVIGMVLLALGAFSLWSGCGTVRPWALALLPVATRSAAAVAVTCMKPMGHSQYAGVFDRRDRARTLALPAVCLAVSCVLPAALWGAAGLAPLAGACGYGLAVRYAARQLGGVSGDVSGFALTLGELCGAAALALV